MINKHKILDSGYPTCEGAMMFGGTEDLKDNGGFFLNLRGGHTV